MEEVPPERRPGYDQQQAQRSEKRAPCTAVFVELAAEAVGVAEAFYGGVKRLLGGDAVGFSSFIPPGSGGGDGYTIAVEGGTRGVVVAVGGTDDARLFAAQVAIFAGQAA